MAYVYDPRTGYYNENYQEKPTAFQQAQTDKLKTEAEQQEQNEIYGSGSLKRKTAEQLERTKGYASENVANIQASAARDVARIRAGGYNKGGPVQDIRPGPANSRNYAKSGPVRR